MHFDPDSILELDAKLRRLARALIADAANADDVVQRAWVAAVKRRDDAAPARSPLAWLQGAVRKLAFEQFRADSRRSRNEGRATPPESSWTAPEILEREAVRRAVVNAVVGLQEPYRETLLLRFYEGLSTREIARRVGAPINTVTSRIQRGLALVRAQLEAGGDSHSSMLALIPFAASGPPVSLGLASSVALKVIAMNMNAKVAIAVCVLVVAGAAVFQAIEGDRADDSASKLPRTPTAPDPPSLVADAAKVGDPPAIAREETKTPATPPVPATDSKSGALALHVVYDSDGAPAAGVTIGAMCWGDANPYAHPRRLVTDAAGDTRIDHLPVGRVTLQCALGQDSLRATIAGDETTQVTMRLAAGGTVKGIVRDALGHPMKGADIFMTGAINGPPGDGAIVARTDAAGLFSIRDVNDIQYVGARLEGHASSPLTQVFTAAGQVVELVLVLGTPCGIIEGEVATSEGATIAAADVLFDPTNGAPMGFSKEIACIPSPTTTDASGRFRIADLPPGTNKIRAWAPGRAVDEQPVEVVAGGVTRVAFRLLPGARLVGTVKNEAGRPVARAAVRDKENSDSLGSFYARSDETGAFAIDGMPLGEFEVVIDHDLGKTERRLLFTSGQVTRYDAVLASGLSIRGRVIDDAGTPVLHLAIMAKAVGGKPGMGGATTNDQGAFEIANLDPGRFDLELYQEDGALIPVYVEHAVAAGAAEVVITVPHDQLPTVHLTGRVVDTNDVPVGGAQFDFERTGTDGGSQILWADAETGTFECGPVPPGEYTIFVRVPGYADLRGGPKSGGPNETIDFGVLRLAGGRILKIHFVRPKELADAEVYAEITDGSLASSFSCHREGLDVTSNPLPPGKYRVFVSGKGVARTYADVEVKAGSDASLEMTLVPALDRVVRIVEKTATGTFDLPFQVLDEKGVTIFSRPVSRAEAASPFVVHLALAPGKYAVVAREKRVEFVVSESDASEIGVELP